MTVTTTAAPPTRAGSPPDRSGRGEAVPSLILVAGLSVALVALLGIHLGQGSSGLGWSEMVGVLTGDADPQRAAIFWSARVPRALAGCLVGIALGTSGAVLQAIARNPLASPDTLGINAGAHLVLALAAFFGIPFGVLSGTAAAFVGGLAAAAIALLISSGGTSPIRLVLAGSVLALALASITSMLLILRSEATAGLFAWGAGSLGQNGPGPTLRAAPVILVVTAAAILLAHRLDLLQLGDDAARSLGLRVHTTRMLMVGLAVLLAAAAVSVAGPIGFVGLCAPACVRIVRRWVPSLRFHRLLVLCSALTAAVIVLLADVVLRVLFGTEDAVEVPTGVVTTVLGAVFVIALSQGMRTGRSDVSPALVQAWRFGRRHAWLLISAAAGLLVLAGWSALLVGDVWLLGGDVVNWLTQVASVRIELVLESRWPRVAAAIVAGGCLAMAGSLVQTATRNPLADPGLLGVTAGAGAGAIMSITVLPQAGWTGLLCGALFGGLIAAVIVFGLASRGGLDGVRLVLVGIGVSAGASAATTLFVVRTDPYNQAKAITWLGGSTYGTDVPRMLAACLVLVGAGVIAAAMRRDLDLLQLDPTTPRILGVPAGRTRLVILVTAVACTIVATTAVGVISFVGLVGPHLARLLVGARHRHVVPLAVLLGALLVVVADAVGRTIIAPAQIPAGMVTSLLGTPYFVWLLWKLRGDRT